MSGEAKTETVTLPLWNEIRPAARELSCSPSHLYRMVERGEIPERHIKRIGRAIRISREYLLCGDE